MELALEADELAAVGPELKVRDPFLAAAVPYRHSRGGRRGADMHTKLSKSLAGSRRDGLRSRMAILARMQRADAPPPSVGPDGGGPSASKGRDAWKSARGQTTRRVYSIEDVIIIIAHQKRF